LHTINLRGLRFVRLDNTGFERGMSLSPPILCVSRSYVHEDWIQSIVLWDTQNLGYLTVLAAKAVAEGQLKRGDTILNAGRLGTLRVEDDQILLGEPFVFTKDNIDQYDF